MASAPLPAPCVVPAATASVAQLTDPNAANNPSLLQELEATGREMDQEFQQMDNDALTADGTGSAGACETGTLEAAAG